MNWITANLSPVLLSDDVKAVQVFPVLAEVEWMSGLSVVTITSALRITVWCWSYTSLLLFSNSLLSMFLSSHHPHHLGCLWKTPSVVKPPCYTSCSLFGLLKSQLCCIFFLFHPAHNYQTLSSGSNTLNVGLII